MDFEEEICELEMLRNESVKFLNDLVMEEMGNVAESVKVLNDMGSSFKRAAKPKPARKRTSAPGFRVNLNRLLPERRKSDRLAHRDPPTYADMDDQDEADKENEVDPSIEDVVFRKKRVYHRTKASVPPITASDIDEDYIDGVCYQVSLKVYCPNTGTSCHQCRQKTKDNKTICKSGRCIGVRGQFCGVCLQNRYGENAEDALRNPVWCCPPCRGICNCSICRTRQGKRPTGIMTPIAQSQGHKSVKDYLTSLKGVEHTTTVPKVVYKPGDVLGFTEQGNIWNIPELDESVMGFEKDEAIHVNSQRLVTSLETFEKIIKSFKQN